MYSVLLRDFSDSENTHNILQMFNSFKIEEFMNTFFTLWKSTLINY